MHRSTYLLLIEDTLQYFKDLLSLKPPSLLPLHLAHPSASNPISHPPTHPILSIQTDPKDHSKPLPALPSDQEKKQKNPPQNVSSIPSNPTPIDLFLKLEPPSPPSPFPVSMAKKYLQKIDPTLPFCPTIPKDSKAKTIREGWQKRSGIPSIPILFQGREHRTLITNLAKAIDTTYGSCQVIDVLPNQDWSFFLETRHLKLIVSSEKVIFDNKPLLSFYREIPQKDVRTLGHVPILFIPDLGLYIKDPALKRSLWNMICKTLNSLPSS